MAVTLRDVARMANVAVSTVSDVLNNRDARYSEDLRQRVFRTASDLGYRPNAVARSLITRKSNTVALMVVTPFTSYFNDIINEVGVQLRHRDYHLIVVTVPTRSVLHAFDDELRALEARQVDGVIFLTGCDDENETNACKHITDTDIPLVLVDQLVESVNASFVGTDDVTGAREATQYLIDKGHRRIGHMSTAHSSATGRARLRGYREALEQSGVEFDPKLVVDVDFTAGEVPDISDAYINIPDPVTAVFCTNDIVAAAFYRFCWEQGLRIPDDISVVGYAGLYLGEYLTPPLTTVFQSAEKVARCAVDLLFEQIDGEGQKLSARSVHIKTRVIERCSVRSLL